MESGFETRDPSSLKRNVVIHRGSGMNQFAGIAIDLIIVSETILIVIDTVVLTKINALTNAIGQCQSGSNMDTCIRDIRDSPVVTGHRSIVCSNEWEYATDAEEKQRSKRRGRFQKERLTMHSALSTWAKTWAMARPCRCVMNVGREIVVKYSSVPIKETSNDFDEK